MGWKEYYQSQCTPFAEQTSGYRRVIGKLKEGNPKFLDPKKPQRFVLGGFFPTNGSGEQFIEFCQEIHPNPADTFIFLDMNRRPLESAPRPTKVQALLERPPFRRETIDALFLDYTLYLMNDEQVWNSNISALNYLTRGGAILAATPARPPLAPLDFFDDRPTGWVPSYFRSPSDVMHLCYQIGDSKERIVPQALIKEGNAYIWGFTKQVS